CIALIIYLRPLSTLLPCTTLFRSSSEISNPGTWGTGTPWGFSTCIFAILDRDTCCSFGGFGERLRIWSKACCTGSVLDIAATSLCGSAVLLFFYSRCRSRLFDTAAIAAIIRLNQDGNPAISGIFHTDFIALDGHEVFWQILIDSGGDKDLFNICCEFHQLFAAFGI